MPKLCATNGFVFPPIPEELRGLTDLEERLIAARIPFMQIRPLGIDKQYGLKGSVVNIPNDVDKTVNLLPRNFEDSGTIQLKFKRMLTHKSDFMHEMVRPNRVLTAAEYLVQQDLYKTEGINLSLVWHTQFTENEVPFVVRAEDLKNDDDVIKEESMKDDNESGVQSSDENPNAQMTLLDNFDPNIDVISIAPGEGKFPLSILKDKYIEELSFPVLFCGFSRQLKIKLSYTDICKAELRNADRRFARILNIFFKFKKRQLKHLIDTVNFCCLRRTKNTDNVNAGQLLDENFVENLIRSDDGFRILSRDRASPTFWHDRRRDLFAMIRQLGLPTLFLTLSAAEMHWPELLVILTKTVNGVDITEQEAAKLPTKAKYELISADPVTCARYFDMRYRELFRVLMAPNGPFG